MDKEKLKNEIFIGIVEDNADPKKLGRVKVRVASVYDEMPTEDIPWASAFKDLNGNEFNMPDVGKLVSVVFGNGNIYKPEYIYADHYNINLENKLKSLSDDNYKTFKAVFLDHSTQIYRTESDGLKIDHEYSNLNLDKNGNIRLNLRDDKSIITLGSRDAAEKSVLGSTFMEWMDKLVDNLLQGPYLGNLGSPVVAQPGFINCLTEYKAKRQQFLSNHVKISKNNKIESQSRDYKKQFGDGVNSKTEDSPYSPDSDYKSAIPKDENPASTIDDTDLGNEDVSSTESVGPPDIDKANVAILWNCNIFNQGDIRWGNYSGSGTTMRRAGCCLSTYAMASSAYGLNATPGDFYKASGNNVVAYWGTISSKYKQTTTPSFYYSIDQNKLDNLLSKGPLLWESKNKKDKSSKGGVMAPYVRGNQHWMAITGKNKDGTYIVYDPNGGKVRTSVPIDHILYRLGRIGVINKGNASRA